MAKMFVVDGVALTFDEWFNLQAYGRVIVPPTRIVTPADDPRIRGDIACQIIVDDSAHGYRLGDIVQYAGMDWTENEKPTSPEFGIMKVAAVAPSLNGRNRRERRRNASRRYRE